MKIGIIGLGYVGRAVQHSWMDTEHEVIFHDPYLPGSIPLPALVDLKPNIIFICVPTPANENGSCDTSIVKDTIDFLINHYVGTIVVKSTTDPEFWQRYVGVEELWHIPEFLTAKNANEDYLHPKFIFVGGNGNSLNLINLLSTSRMDTTVEFYWTDLMTASLVKYFMNTFLANKIVMLNQFKLISDKIGAEWEDFKPMLSMDSRMGDSHLNVPGHDGSLGYGGACFPKDVRAIIDLAQRTDTSIGILESIENANKKIRNE
jgi:UDPglucose 6-dehydrogenase